MLGILFGVQKIFADPEKEENGYNGIFLRSLGAVMYADKSLLVLHLSSTILS